MSSSNPGHGDIWLANLDTIVGHEQAGERPVLIISDDNVNSGPSGLVIVIPLTTTNRNNPWHIRIAPPEGGRKLVSFALCEHVRSISKKRLTTSSAFGRVSPQTLNRIKTIISVLLDM